MSTHEHGRPMATADRATAILDAYGADPARWPEGEREGVLALIGARPDLARRQLDEATLDQMMGKGVEPGVPRVATSALMARILAAAEREGAPSRRSGAAQPNRQGWRHGNWLNALWPFGPPWQPASALVAAALLGIIAGATLQGGYADDDYGLAAFDLISDADILP